MFATIVIGIDGSHGDRDALALASRVAAPGARLTLAHIWNELEGVAAVAVGNKHPSKAAHELLEPMSRRLGPNCRVAIRAGTSPGAGLHHLADELGADLIIIGATHESRTERLLVRDETHVALHGAPCAVAVAVPGEAQDGREIRSVGVAYEPTDGGEAALAIARDLAAGRGAELHAIHVLPPAQIGRPGDPRSRVERFELQAIDEVEAARQELAQRGGLTAHVARGEVVDQLARFAATVDLLVIGPRRHGSPIQMLVGSTGERLARACHTSLVVTARAPVPPAQQRPVAVASARP